MPIRVSQSQYVTNVQQGVSQKQGNYAKGVQNAGPWQQPFIDSIDRMVSGILAAQANGMIAAGAQKVSDSQWKNITASKANNWISAYSNPTVQQNLQNGAARLYTMLGNALNAVDAIPKGDINASKNRVLAFIDSMHNQKVQG